MDIQKIIIYSGLQHCAYATDTIKIKNYINLNVGHQGGIALY